MTTGCVPPPSSPSVRGTFRITRRSLDRHPPSSPVTTRRTPVPFFAQRVLRTSGSSSWPKAAAGSARKIAAVNDGNSPMRGASQRDTARRGVMVAIKTSAVLSIGCPQVQRNRGSGGTSRSPVNGSGSFAHKSGGSRTGSRAPAYEHPIFSRSRGRTIDRSAHGRRRRAGLGRALTRTRSAPRHRWASRTGWRGSSVRDDDGSSSRRDALKGCAER